MSVNLGNRSRLGG